MNNDLVVYELMATKAAVQKAAETKSEGKDLIAQEPKESTELDGEDLLATRQMATDSSNGYVGQAAGFVPEAKGKERVGDKEAAAGESQSPPKKPKLVNVNLEAVSSSVGQGSGTVAQAANESESEFAGYDYVGK